MTDYRMKAETGHIFKDDSAWARLGRWLPHGIAWIGLAAGLLFLTFCTGHPAYAKGDNDVTPAIDPAGVFSPVAEYVNGVKGDDTDLANVFCTGFYVGEGRFISAGHCLAEQTDEWRIVVDNPNGGKHTFKPNFILTSNPKTFGGQDFSVTYVDLQVVNDLTPLALDCSYVPVVGNLLTLEGFPEGLGRMITTGFIASAKVTPLAIGGWSKPLIRVQLPASYGNSGSPVRLGGLDGKVIGIMVGLLPDNRSLGAVQPISGICMALGIDKAAAIK